MAITSALAIYFVLWWLVLFAVLPFGVQSQNESGLELAGTDPGAPMLARMGAKLLLTTLLSAVIFAIAFAAYKNDYLNVERLTKLMGIPL